jgi:hypothetical protein
MNDIYLKRVTEQDIERLCEIFLDKDAWPYEETETPDYNTLKNRVHDNLNSSSILNFLVCTKDENSIGLAFLWVQAIPKLKLVAQYYHLTEKKVME